MDAFAVALANGMAFSGCARQKLLAVPAMFALFQAAMPVAGFYFGCIFAAHIGGYADYAVLAILGIIGMKMLWEGMSREDCKEQQRPHREFTPGLLIVQSLATSIDALAVGISLSLVSVSIFPAAALIGIATFALCTAAVLLGKKLGKCMGRRAEIAGGLLLILMAIMSVF